MGQMEGMEAVVLEVEDEDEVEEIENQEKWENLLPKTVLRVLLVEADDSTRQIIGALLRKCNYKVAAISDGLKAWEVLKRHHNNIDLILTELDLPSISGYALLTLIMEHDNCKHIPVIVMSSQDSVSLVLKCILKGAADFLIKPVRKNELKNLWRHVWKRLANNAGYIPQKEIAGQHKTEAMENNRVNLSDDNVSSSNASRATDVQGLSQRKLEEETGLGYKEGKHQAKHVKVEGETPLASRVFEDRTENFGFAVETSKEINVSTACRVEEDIYSTGIATDDANDGIRNQSYRDNNITPEHPMSSIEAVDFIGKIDCKPKSIAAKSSVLKEPNGQNSTPELELSLKRPLDLQHKEAQERPILNHSNASAFSWYSSNKKPRTSFVVSDVEIPTIKGVIDSSSWPKPSCKSGENKPHTLHHIGFVPLTGLTFDSGRWPSCGTVIQPACSSQKGPTVRSPSSSLHREEPPFLTTSPSLYSDPGTNSSIQGCGQAGDELKTTDSVEQHGQSSSQVVDPGSSGTQSNHFGNYYQKSAHGSASEITDVNATSSGTKGMSSVVESESCKQITRDQFKSTMGLHSAEREAALAKFRQKRKDRCFEKKVRYQSRKRLAEQRPRVKGQFVRQSPNESGDCK
ncbi:unnamed protein product [Amaranthus hypochondriacus]